MVIFCCAECALSCLSGPILCLPVARLYYSRRMLFYEHVELLEAAKNREANLQIQAGWASRSWTQVVSATLGLLVDKTALHQLGIKNAPGDANIRQRAEAFVRLIFGTASKRAWSMSVYDLPGKSKPSHRTACRPAHRAFRSPSHSAHPLPKTPASLEWARPTGSASKSESRSWTTNSL